MSAMRLMMGTGPFAVPTFRSLMESHHAVVALVTGALKHEGQRPAATSPMREAAARHGTPIFDPENVNAPPSLERIGQFEADLLVVCDYGQILSTATLAKARLGGINLHASLLPKYRGAAPINWALFHGEKETGVSVIHMTPRVDAGPVIAQGSTPIDADETAVELEARLAQIGAGLVRRAIDSLESGTPEALPQRSGLGLEGPAAEEDRRGHRLESAGPGDQEPDPRPGALAQDLHLLAPAGRPAAAVDPRSGERRPGRRYGPAGPRAGSLPRPAAGRHAATGRPA